MTLDNIPDIAQFSDKDLAVMWYERYNTWPVNGVRKITQDTINDLTSVDNIAASYNLFQRYASKKYNSDVIKAYTFDIFKKYFDAHMWIDFTLEVLKTDPNNPYSTEPLYTELLYAILRKDWSSYIQVWGKMSERHAGKTTIKPFEWSDKVRIYPTTDSDTL
jgi:hypothetical protein